MTLKDLWRKQRLEESQIKSEIYEEFLSELIYMISSEDLKGYKSYLYTIPQTPYLSVYKNLYNKSECRDYIENHLRQDEYYTEKRGENLFISWDNSMYVEDEIEPEKIVEDRVDNEFVEISGSDLRNRAKLLEYIGNWKNKNKQ